MTADGAFGLALAEAGVTADALPPDDATALDAQGYTILRGVVPAEALDELRTRFEAAVLPSEQWPMPREAKSRFAMLNADPAVRSVCLSPRLLAVAHHVIGARFFLSDVQGRDPQKGGGRQAFHRDWPDAARRMVACLLFLDDFGADNGATRVVPATHGEPGEMSVGDLEQDPRVTTVQGRAGDALLFDARLAHAGQRNTSGAPRRTLQISYLTYAERAAFRETRVLGPVAPLERHLLGLN